MEHEFLDDMFERLLVAEDFSFPEACEKVIQERAETIRDLGRIENAYRLFCKKHPAADPNYFRSYVRITRPNDYEKCVRCFGWK